MNINKKQDSKDNKQEKKRRVYKVMTKEEHEAK